MSLLKYLVFNEGELIEEGKTNEFHPFFRLKRQPPKAIIYINSKIEREVKWFRSDLTPMLIEEVPKELQLMTLLLN